MIERSFDLAPHAPRYSPFSWLALGVAALLSILACVSTVVALRDWQGATDTAQRARAEARKHRTKETARARDIAAIQVAQKAGQQLEDRVNLSWTGIFSALEAAGRETGGEAVLMTMSTSAPATGGPLMGLSCIASSPAAMLKYVRALRMQAGIGSVRLLSQERSTSAGPDGVSFQLSVSGPPS